jgi:hypothetical protein
MIARDSRKGTGHANLSKNRDAKSTIFSFGDLCHSVLLPVHERCEVFRVLSFGTLEGKVYLSWYGKNIAKVVVCAKVALCRMLRFV